MSRAHAAGVFVLFTGTALAVTWPSLPYYWNWDDLHLIRSFTGGELLATFRGQWALSPYETLGLRPITTLFNYARWAMFGEQVVAHRVFLAALFAGYLTLLVGLLCRLGGDWVAGLMAGVITLCAKNSYYHVVWIADGIHLFQGLLVAAAAHLALSVLERPRPGAWLGAWGLLAMALLTREDSLVGYPFVLAVCAFQAWRRSTLDHAARPLTRFGAALAATWLAIWVWRLVAVPNAPQVKFTVDSLVRVWHMAQWTIGLAGQRDPAAPVFVLLAFATVGATLLLRPCERHSSWLWLLLTALAVTPGNVRAVPNLLVFATSFYAFFLGIVWHGVASRGRIGALAALVVLAGTVTLGARASRLEQLSLHPLSADQMRRDWMFVYGPFRDSVIPGERVRLLREKLDRYGLNTPDFDFDRWFATLTAEGSTGPEAGRPFVPPRLFLQP